MWNVQLLINGYVLIDGHELIRYMVFDMLLGTATCVGGYDSIELKFEILSCRIELQNIIRTGPISLH